jgi:hypothetical protein
MEAPVSVAGEDLGASSVHDGRANAVCPREEEQKSKPKSARPA